MTEYTVVSAEHIEADYSVSTQVDYPFADFADEQEQRLYKGGLRVQGDFESESDVDWNPYNIVVDGNLIVDGTVDWCDYGSGCFVLVTGNMRCKNLLLQGCPTIVVRGSLEVENAIQGHHGDDGGYLKVGGTTKAKMIVNTLYFNMEFDSAPEALVCGDPHRMTCPVDFDDSELGEVFLPEWLDDSGIDERKVQKALREGHDVLRPGVRPSHQLALESIERLIAAGAPVEELDLSQKKLRGFPARVVELRGLKRLSLRGNDLGTIPDSIAKLTELESLDLAETGLEALPDAFADLGKLTTLDLSRNPFDVLPPVIARLPSLRVLRANMLVGADIDALGDAANLEELEISYFKPGGGVKLTPFPRAILRLSKLRSLDISSAAISDVPDDIANLSELETLNLDGSLGHLERLPPLHRLPKLRALHIAGGASNTGKYAPHALYDGVWAITTLEHLGIDRYGEEKSRGAVIRPALQALPDDAFAKLPNLKVMDLSFNDFTRLPESFFALTKLEFVDLRYTKLDKTTLERLRTTFPRVKLDLRNVETRFDVDDPNWKAVHALVKAAAGNASNDKPGAVAGFEAALALCTPGACFSDYDELYALYGLVDAMGHTRLRSTGAEKEALGEKIIHYATIALERVPAPGMIWHFTNEGAFQEEVTRRAGNALAWMLMERGELERAISVADRAISVGGMTGYIKDTKVRILLKAGRDHDAYLIVDRILTEDPSFGDFQDLRASPAFQTWRAANRAP
ncbi:Leucine-rich-repeat protein [Labilithrix luteola]|uniref:Leucine-rich-repeat protein n=1 Tax=Labilithrix luteola TaxID=1391654 RepID=A0A0K1PM25_9BACT|nr:leucine-rich repeat domain-containing protein [Labilithrix luteola]AKU94575.1 Leucine-rich-repeat protein [Labilithrix luteola]